MSTENRGPTPTSYPAGSFWGVWLPAGMSPHPEARARRFALAASSTRAGVVLALVFALVACASTPTDRIVYNSLSGAVDGVHAAMGAFNEVYQQGKATEQQRTQVLAAYKHFQDVARAAAKVAKDAPDQTPVQIALDAAAELVRLIQTWTKGR